jgi:E3 ubiquitin-protein ligase DOA10
MINKKYLPTLVCGFAAAVLSTVPGIKNFSCCLLVPGAAALSILLDKKINQSNEKVLLSKSIGFGFLTGLFATLFITAFDVILTYFIKTNEFIQSLPQIELTMRQWNLGPMVDESLKIIKYVAKEIEKNGFSFIYLLMILSSNFIVNSIFGMIGGTLGMSLANRKSREGNSDL